MSRARENAAFLCHRCGLEVAPLSNGGYRNHCPGCLYSQHVDNLPGDRGSSCKGMMEPVGLRYRSGKGFQVVHRCLACGTVRVNKVARDTAQPDEWDVDVRLPADDSPS